MVTEVYSHFLGEDRKLNAKKFDETFYIQSIDYTKKSGDIDKLVFALQKEPNLMKQLIDALK